jgi:hypothetical protein
MFSTGNVLSFSYPTDNRIGVRTRLASRRIVVRAERDLRLAPLEPVTIKLDPARRRGQLLVAGFDIDRQRWRRFYFDSMRSIKISEQPLTRLGMFDSLSDREPRLFGRLFTDSRADQAEVKRLIELANRWLADHGSSECVGLFPLVKVSA